MATYNKNECLSNTLYSLARQKTTFPVEVCIVDDVSVQDPVNIIKKFIPSCKYKRLDKYAGVYWSIGKCLDLVSDDTDVIVLQSCDVIYTQDNIIETLCRSVAPKVFTMPEVRDLEVNPNMYKNFDKELKQLVSGKALRYRMEHGPWHIFYSGSKQPDPATRWYFFLGAIRKDDLLSTNFKNNAFDKKIAKEMKEKRFSPRYLDSLIGIHQKHKAMNYKGHRRGMP